MKVNKRKERRAVYRSRRETVYFYAIHPIDFWGNEAGSEIAGDQSSHYDGFAEFAEKRFREIGWDGHMGNKTFFVIPDPNSCEMKIGYIRKGDHAGTCYVASTMPLAHLEKDAVEKLIVRVAHKAEETVIKKEEPQPLFN